MGAQSWLDLQGLRLHRSLFGTIVMSTFLADALPRVAVRRLFWRVHFWAGLITAPLVCFAAATGLLYVFTPQIEARLHAGLDHVPIGAAVQSLDAQVDAAQAAFPMLSVRDITPSNASGQTTEVAFAPMQHAAHDGAGHVGHAPGLPQGRLVYVDPYRAQVVGSLDEMDRFRNWARKLHSSMLQGDRWRWPIELAASWMLVMLATGITMWWPRSRADGGPGWRALVPRWGRGRLTWRDLHTVVGVLMSGLLTVVLVTGLTWSRFAGDNFRAAQQALSQATPKPPQPSVGQWAPATTGPRATLQQLLDAARAQRSPGTSALQLSPTKRSDGAWRVETIGRDQPLSRMSLLLDPASARVLYRSGWDELPTLSKATAIGIPFHRAEFGAWNQAVIAAAALAAIFAVVSGVTMWWKRRPAGRLGVPPVGVRELRRVPYALGILTVALGIAMPLFGMSLIAFALLELAAAVLQRQGPAAPVA